MISDGEGVATAEIETKVPEVVELAVTTGLERFSGAGEGRKFQIMRTGVRFLGKMTFEQWREALRGLQNVQDLFHIVLADFIEYGKAEFGEEKVDETLELFNFDMADVLKSHAIGQLSLDIRTNFLTSEHLYILSKSLPNAKKEQGRWAAIADKEQLSAIELKKSIEKGKIVRHEQIDQESGRDSGIPNIEGLSLVFQRWEKQAGGEEKILQQPEDWKRDFLKEVDPIVDLARKVESTLPDNPPEN